MASYPTIIQESLEVQGPSIANNDATNLFNKQRSAIFSVSQYLTPAQTAKATKYIGAPLYGRAEGGAITDHLELKVAREIMRDYMIKELGLEREGVETLCMGVSMWEIHRFAMNEATRFHIHDGDGKTTPEAKDAGRIGLKLVAEALNQIKKYGSRKPGMKSTNKISKRARVAKAKTSRLSDWVGVLNSGMTHPRIHEGRAAAFSLGTSRLCYFDSAYDVGLAGIARDAFKTGAVEFNILGFFPNFLIDEKVPESDLYEIEEIPSEAYAALKGYANEFALSCLIHVGFTLDMVPILAAAYSAYLALCGASSILVPGAVAMSVIAKLFPAGFQSTYLIWFISRLVSYVRDSLTRVTVTWKGGVANGYGHNKRVWKELLHARKYVSYEYGIELNTEIKGRLGEMYWIQGTVSKIGDAGPSYSRLCLDTQFDYVEVFDFTANWDAGNKAFKHKDSWVYKSVYRYDFEASYLWAMAEPDNTLTAELVVNAVAKMREGLAINNNEYLPPWKLQARDVPLLAFAVMIETTRQHGILKDMKRNTDLYDSYESNIEKLLLSLARGAIFAATGTLIIPIVHFVAWLMETSPELEIIRYPNRPKLNVAESTSGMAAAVKKLYDLKKKRHAARVAVAKARKENPGATEAEIEVLAANELEDIVEGMSEWKPRYGGVIRTEKEEVRKTKCSVC